MKAKNKKTKKELTKEKEPKRRILRVPRPMGITALCRDLNKEPTKKEVEDQNTFPSNPQSQRNRIIRIYLNAYTNNQLIEYDNITKEYKLITIQKLAYLLNTDTNTIMILLTKEFSRMGVMMDRAKVEITRGLLLRAIFEGAELSALTAQQTAILMASQGGKYAPFISGEVNRAIGNQIAAMKPKLDLLKLLFDGRSGTISPTQQGTPDGQPTGTYLTVEMAHNLLAEGHQSVLTNEALRGQIIDTSNDLKLLPETNPNYQGGDILSSKSLYQNVPEELQNQSENGTHSDRNKARKGLTEVEDEDEFRA
jgi:hypothetical protein